MDVQMVAVASQDIHRMKPLKRKGLETRHGDQLFLNDVQTLCFFVGKKRLTLGEFRCDFRDTFVPGKWVDGIGIGLLNSDCCSWCSLQPQEQPTRRLLCPFVIAGPNRWPGGNGWVSGSDVFAQRCQLLGSSFGQPSNGRCVVLGGSVAGVDGELREHGGVRVV